MCSCFKMQKKKQNIYYPICRALQQISTTKMSLVQHTKLKFQYHFTFIIQNTVGY